MSKPKYLVHAQVCTIGGTGVNYVDVTWDHTGEIYPELLPNLIEAAMFLEQERIDQPYGPDKPGMPKVHAAEILSWSRYDEEGS